MIPALRVARTPAGVERLVADAGVESRDVTIDGADGAALRVSVLTPPGQRGPGPGIVHAHGGGMFMGTRWTGVPMLLPWLVEHGAVAVTVEYRLAPEHPDPIPVEDVYAALTWTAAHAAELGIDPDRLMIEGGSAGGGLAAGATLLARDRGGPPLHAQLLICPMLDDRDATVSTRQIDGVGVWDRGSNRTGWTALLGDRRGGPDVSIYAAPARASDLSGLPPTFVDVGSAEVFRDECVAYAQGIWAAGGRAELHVWPGGYHGFDSLVPTAAVSRAAVAARDAWVRRMIGQPQFS
ncbi:lipase [Jiangella anatolica]|uniref:Lipase n=2 Tax=Jiangella anatolica TaxID=2670374 RepID=A0A2W2AWS3_9ACTN|nr:lipase [Jiangella anatolica]